MGKSNKGRKSFVESNGVHFSNKDLVRQRPQPHFVTTTTSKFAHVFTFRPSK